MNKIQEQKKVKQTRTSKDAEVGVAENIIHRLAFESSSQANIIFTVVDGKIIFANKAACQLLEYSEKELLTKDKSAVFASSDGSFKKMMKQRQASALVAAIKKNGKSFRCQITSAVFINDGIEQAVTTLTDMSQSILKQKKIDAKSKKTVADNIVIARSKQKKIDIEKEKIVANDIIAAKAKSDARLAENNEWIKYIAKTSYDVMWDWDVATGEIYVGDSVEEVFGYKIKNNTIHFSDFLQCLPAHEKDVMEKRLFKKLGSGSKSWNDSYLFKRYDGSIAATTSRASIIRGEDRKALRLIGATQDVSRVQELETKLEEQTTIQKPERKNLSQDNQHSFEVIWHWNLETNEVFTGDEFEVLFGYVIKNNKSNINDWKHCIHPDDKKEVEKSLAEVLASPATYWQCNYRFIRANGTIANVSVRASIFRQADGKANRIIGVLQDRSPQQEYGKGGTAALPDKKSILIDKIKNVISELVLFSDELVQTNYSAYLSNKLHYDYTYLANLFSLAEGISIQTFIITQKINRVKELIIGDELNLTEISRKLHYSSVAHLSNQFKKVTGFTPTQFKQLDQIQRTTAANVGNL